MELDLLMGYFSIDGRYRGKTEALASYFSEYALIRYRVRVEIEYFITLCELPLPPLADFNHDLFSRLRDIYRNFTEADAGRVKEIESVTNHDVKAVEYFITEEFDKIGGLEAYKEFIHFGLTSQDINNTSVRFVHQRSFGGMLLSPDGGTDSPASRVCRGMERRVHVGQDTRTACFSHPFGERSWGICLSSGTPVGDA